MAAEAQPGQQIDAWRLVSLRLRGGMADLWDVERAEPWPSDIAEDDPARRLPLLMKLPRQRPGQDATALVGFEVEQMILPALQGPHVPQFIARGESAGRPWLVMERIDGPSLLPRLEASPLPIAEVADLAQRVVAALHALHRQRVVHLDVKPSNLMLRPDGTVVLIDFGLSHHDRLPDLLAEEYSLPSSVKMVGTGPYMSPEQVQYIRDDPRSDLFALGVMLYHFTTGERPFGAPQSERGLRQRLHRDPVPPRSLRSDCPPWLQEVILQCLEVDPARRWQSAAQLALALADPAQLPLSERATRRQAAGWLERLKRRWRLSLAEPVRRPLQAVSTQVMRSPIILAAVDIDQAAAGLLEQLRETVRRILVTEPGARLACLCVLRSGRISMDDAPAADEPSHHARQRAALRDWARPISQGLGLDGARLTFHVLEAPDPAAAIVEFAERNQVDHIVMGARGNSALRRYLGSVSSQVVAQAECTVTVVRA